ncbi:NADH dehydrogenase 1 alpha subcomplex subunit 4-like 2 [Wallemia ichthyophaga EXF-994]|uniref:NADH dehydrogenase 1 alpha subcomplex subunit 4-like 2 n=1 Tax=Wallemia ichthyophaga (strain EXF-994 / CBS 113033) TaxID=1299270 RepID=R9ADF2_WALI9|nr:NADH dehydrogenase 1 alpha subcomplex subunit 4-like 2 [Wallemia ichthyophaga EXF-994]EOR00188.1 NADH dehydrogenase 1 alpha subcomplex subunit 4-like 2 [Wallemia ichthyophaga EXF-994]
MGKLPVPVETYPIIAIIGGAIGGAGWYLARLAQGPEVVWDRKNNPHPWQDIKPGQTTKLLNYNDQVGTEGKWSRNRL